MSADRPDPDALLARVQAEETLKQRGRLKIFFGMAPGVGKTYAMLEAARKVAKEGADLIVGYVEPHARPETYALVLGLDVLPKKMVDYRGRMIPEFDLQLALSRKPQIIVVDELAHSNPPGSIHPKRWQDVEDLLDAGIDVYTSLNVQHLESLNDVVAQITSIPVRETVPDRVFEEADEVELIDISPEDLIDRLRSGKVYVSTQAARAIENFFRRGNLIALRELALRKTADRVGAETVDYRQTHAVESIWPTSERLLVCVGPSPMSARLIRATRRMAASLHSPWIALHVEANAARTLSPGDRQRLEENLRLAEELGATVATVAGEAFASTVIDYCRRQNVSRIIAGKPKFPRWMEWWRGSLVSELIRESGDIDVYVISGEGAEAAQPQTARDRTAHAWGPYFWSMAVVVICTLISWAMSRFFEPTNLVMIYLAGVVVVALAQGRGPSILATVLGVAAFDVLFIPPYGTLAVSDTQYLLTFAIMLITGIVISELTARVRSQAIHLRDREQRTSALYALSKQLSGLSTREAIIWASREIIQRELAVTAWILGIDGEGHLSEPESATESPPASDDGVVRWVFEHSRPAGPGTDTLPGASATYLPLLAPSGIVGVLGVRPREPEAQLALAQRDMLQAFASQIAGALERCSLAEVAEHARLEMETERLRNTLLSTVSHDLRTPLATITGAASTLVAGPGLEEHQRTELAESIVDESERLNRLVANLLDLTRLESHAIQLHKELQPIDEVVEVTLARMERLLRDHHVQSSIADDLPPVAIDGLLMQQVLTNLLDNAAKYSPPGTEIELVGRHAGRNLILEIADRGPGLPAGEERQIFEKFHRVAGNARAGTGIGLTICRCIVELHGGTIAAENREGGGALFRVTLPLPPESSFAAPPSQL